MKLTTVKGFMRMIPKYNIGDYVNIGVAKDHIYAEAIVVEISDHSGWFNYKVKVVEDVSDGGFRVGNTHTYGDSVLYPCDRDDSQLSDWV
jgi:hypothetical protein